VPIAHPVVAVVASRKALMVPTFQAPRGRRLQRAAVQAPMAVPAVRAAPDVPVAMVVMAVTVPQVAVPLYFPHADY